MTEPTPHTQRKPSPYLQLVVGVLVLFAASFAALLAAGELGAAGVVIAALIEATAVAALYRWCAA